MNDDVAEICVRTLALLVGELRDALAQICEMAEAHAEAHPESATAMAYIRERCTP